MPENYFFFKNLPQDLSNFKSKTSFTKVQKAQAQVQELKHDSDPKYESCSIRHPRHLAHVSTNFQPLVTASGTGPALI